MANVFTTRGDSLFVRSDPYYRNFPYLVYDDGGLDIHESIDPELYRSIIDIYLNIKNWCASQQEIRRDKVVLTVDYDSYHQCLDFSVNVGRKFIFGHTFILSYIGDSKDEIAGQLISAIDAHLQQIREHALPEIRREWANARESRIELPRAWASLYEWTLSKTPEKENEKAKKLLWSCLSRKQKKMYKQNKTFIAIGNVTGTRYLIQNKTQINIVQLDDDGNWVEKLCTVPAERIPVEDHQLAQKLMIETEEDVFLDKVIRWSI